MAELPNPHDRFFRERMADPAVAGDFLRHYLPARMVGDLDLGAVELTPDSHVDAALREHRFDLVYRVGLAGGGEAFVYVLLEHKSYPDPQVAFQLLRYVLKLWESRVRQGEQGPLPPVIPLVVYHGADQWRVPRRFSALVGGPASLRPFLPDFEYLLVDLSRYSDSDLRGAALLRVMLLCLRHIFDEDLAARLPGILSLLRDVAASETGLRAIEAVLRYIGGANDRVGPEALRRAVLEAFPEDGEKIMTTLHGQWIEKGELSRSRKVVVEALKVRFGEVPAPVVDAVAGIEDQGVLEELLRKAITAASLDDFRREVERLRG